MPVLPELHVPPALLFDKVVVMAGDNVVTPVIAGTRLSTVTVKVAVLAHPRALVPVSE